MEGPQNVIASTFSRLSRNDVSSPPVWKKASNDISNSESDNDNEPLHSSIIDDKEILDCLLNLPCISSNKKQMKIMQKAEKHMTEKYPLMETNLCYCLPHQMET